MAKKIFTPTFKKRLCDILLVGIGGSFTFGCLGFYVNNDKFYKNLMMPLLHKLDPEISHILGISMLKYKIPFKADAQKYNSLATDAFGLSFKNPIGIAAGYDKNGEAVEGLVKMGFGFVEVGSITPEPQPGNAKPRVFRLPNSKAVINRYGFNSEGHDAVYDRLSHLNPPGERSYILGINLGKNKESVDPNKDYVLGVQKFGRIADYLVINISSPNTPGLRLLQQKNSIRDLATAVIKARDALPIENRPPILFKISPDLSQQDKKDIAEVISLKQCKIDGLIISNTTISRPENISEDAHAKEVGGLSGQPLSELSLQTQKDMALLTKGNIPIIGVGGIASGEDALEKIYHGACLVQLYTALVYEGPPLIRKVKYELEELLKKDRLDSIKDAVGAKLEVKR